MSANTLGHNLKTHKKKLCRNQTHNNWSLDFTPGERAKTYFVDNLFNYLCTLAKFSPKQGQNLSSQRGRAHGAPEPLSGEAWAATSGSLQPVAAGWPHAHRSTTPGLDSPPVPRNHSRPLSKPVSNQGPS